MDGIHKYPVFFECHSLCREQITKTENYFRIRRRSGGGECGPLRNVNDNIYSIAFKLKKDQQTVLKRSEHVVELADGRLVFTVRGSLEPHASSPSTPSTASPDSTAPVQVFKSVQEAFQLEGFTKDAHQQDQAIDIDQQDEYRSNQFQVEDLLNTIDKMVMENKGGYYTNKMFQEVEKEIRKEEENVRQSSGNMPGEKLHTEGICRVG